jgi:excisionase family DNA binding protein
MSSSDDGRIPLRDMDPSRVSPSVSADLTQEVDPAALLTVPQVMARLQVGRHVVYDLIRSRRLVSVLIGRCRRVPATALRELVDSLAGRQ